MTQPNDPRKRCTRCRILQPCSNFSVRSYNPDVLQSWCKSCHREASREHYAQDIQDAQADAEHEAQAGRLMARVSKDYRRLWRSKAAAWVSQVRKRARDGNAPFSLTADDVMDLWQNAETCPILGIPLFSGRDGVSCPNSPSIDRLKPELGYVLGNVAVISQLANTIKSVGTAEQHRAIADWMDAQQRAIDALVPPDLGDIYDLDAAD